MDKPEQLKYGTVFISGMFNVLHPGHFRVLKYAASLGKRLVVGVFSDALAPAVTVGQQERLQNLEALAFIDDVFILDKSPDLYISKNKPDIVVKGWEHHDQHNPEKEIVEAYGGRLIFSSGEVNITGFSKSETPENSAIKTISKPQGFMQRHNFNSISLQAILERFESLNVCVLGDIIVDQYVTCQAVGMSREDPTIVVRPAGSEFYLGGAGIVSAHASGLGAQVHFLSVSGDDEAGKFSADKLKEYGVNARVFLDDSRPTTQKKRYRANGKTMLRVNEYSDHPISQKLQSQILDHIQNIIHDLDVIIFSDFSYGVLPQKMVDAITELANGHGVILAADSQTSSQTGNITRFKNVSLVTPTEHEARTATKNYVDGLVKLSDAMRKMTDARNVVITLSEEGIFVSGASVQNGIKFDIINDRLHAFQSSAVDPAGAGDALLVTSSMCLAAGSTIWEAMYMGSLASAIQVSRVGNLPLQHKELNEVLLS